jgi:serine/threonine protein kinase
MSIRSPLDSYSRVRVPIASGVDGVVFRVVLERTGSPVAMKIQTDWGDTETEIDLLKRISKVANVVHFREAFKVDDDWVIITDLCQSSNDPKAIPENLEALLKKYPNRFLPAEKLTACIFQLLHVLIDLKDLGIIHADIKSENIVFNPIANELKLLDFGLAKDIFKHKNHQERTTSPYQPPEAFFCSQKVDQPYDMWSLGVLFFLSLYWREELSISVE